MDKQMVRAYLWKAIVRLGFCPVSQKEKKSWLIQYSRSVKQFWRIPSYPTPPGQDNGKLNGHIDCTDLFNLVLEYTVDSMEKFTVRFCYTFPSDGKELFMWTHDVDERAEKSYCFSPQPFFCLQQEKAALKIFTNKDIEAVIDGLLLHPKAHQHLESPIDKHEIRIGGGIDNPFLYLFHLRYQFCPFLDTRNAEKDRLVTLFADALRTQSVITANTLMEQP